MKKILIIMNPKAGKNINRVKIADIVKAFRDKDIDCIEKTTTCHGDATVIAEKYAAGCDAVLCCGGDGTYNETINGVMRLDKKIPVIYLPCGSTNDLASTLDLTKDPVEAVERYVNGIVNSFDIGKFNDRYYTYIASFGVATDLSYNTPQKYKNVMGHTAYVINGFIIHLIPMIANLKAYHMRIEHDGEVTEGDFYFGAVANTCNVAGLFKLEKLGIKMNDGYFEGIFLKKAKFMDFLKLFLKIARQNFDDENFLMFRAKHFKITSDEEAPWTLDGEYGGTPKEIEIEVKEKAIDLVAPDNKFI